MILLINLTFLDEGKNNNSKSYRRLVFDEICANFITLSQNRKRIKKSKKLKILMKNYQKIIKILPFKLTGGQKKVLKEINLDLKSNKRMFRILQGDVGSGKTIVSYYYNSKCYRKWLSMCLNGSN